MAIDGQPRPGRPQGEQVRLSRRAGALALPTCVRGIAASPAPAWSPPRGCTHCRIAARPPAVLDDTARTAPRVVASSGHVGIAPCPRFRPLARWRSHQTMIYIRSIIYPHAGPEADPGGGRGGPRVGARARVAGSDPRGTLQCRAAGAARRKPRRPGHPARGPARSRPRAARARQRTCAPPVLSIDRRGDPRGRRAHPRRRVVSRQLPRGGRRAPVDPREPPRRVLPPASQAGRRSPARLPARPRPGLGLRRPHRQSHRAARPSSASSAHSSARSRSPSASSGPFPSPCAWCWWRISGAWPNESWRAARPATRPTRWPTSCSGSADDRPAPWPSSRSRPTPSRSPSPCSSSSACARRIRRRHPRCGGSTSSWRRWGRRPTSWCASNTRPRRR